MSKNNLAYDLSKYEDAEPRKAPKIDLRRARPESAGSVPKLIALTVSAGLLMGMVIYCKVENAAVHTDITNMTKEVEMLASENVRMQSEIEEKTAIGSIEDYAENILGMQKLDKSQIEYLSITNGSVVDIPENEDNFFVRIKNTFYDFLEYIRG